jgi:thiosulfate/3-mercaptopyruvate sulfurtransferase
LSDEALAELVAASGIGADTTVVVYGYAAYLGYWLLRAYGHRSVCLMDGPRERWAEAGHAFTTDSHGPAPTAPGALAPASDDLVTRETVQALIGDPDTVLVDVRSAEEFRGERFWPSGATEGAGRAGRIPGAVWLPVEVLGGERSAMREACEAAGVVPDRHAVVYCTIGNRASLASFVLTQVLGYPRVSVYYGSWAEWGTAADTPVEVS